MRIIEKMRKKKRLIIAFVITLILMTYSKPVSAYDSSTSSEGIIDKIISAIGSFFGAIIDGFKDFFNTIIDAIKWPFEQVGYMFSNVYYWSWDHLGPLGVVVFTAIAGMTAYVAIFWFKQNIEQIKNW